MSLCMKKKRKLTPTDNEVSRFQALWGTYKAFQLDVVVEGEPVHKQTVQAWRVRNSIPPEYDWIISEAATKRGLFRTQLAALRALNELPGRLRRSAGEGQ